MANRLYKIHVPKFNEHNPGKKSTHKKMLISHKFCDDSKLGVLPVTHRWLFLAILLTCGDLARDTIEMSERQLRAYLESSKSVPRALESLQSLQLLTFEILPPLITELKNNRKEEKNNRREGSAREEPAPPAPPVPAVVELHPLAKIWNDNRGALPLCRSCDGARRKKADQRWKDQTPEAWAETVKKLAASNFCQGKNDRGWKADFDFLLKPETWQKANDGKYDNNRGAVSTAQTRKYDQLDALEQEWKEKAT